MLDLANLQYTNLSPECWYWNVFKRIIYDKHLSDTEQELEKSITVFFTKTQFIGRSAVNLTDLQMTSKFVSTAGHVTLVCCVAANAKLLFSIL